ncbi:uncharacterized protein LOC144213132 [Stigmatopora nigra]
MNLGFCVIFTRLVLVPAHPGLRLHPGISGAPRIAPSSSLQHPSEWRLTRLVPAHPGLRLHPGISGAPRIAPSSSLQHPSEWRLTRWEELADRPQEQLGQMHVATAFIMPDALENVQRHWADPDVDEGDWQNNVTMRFFDSRRLFFTPDQLKCLGVLLEILASVFLS